MEHLYVLRKEAKAIPAGPAIAADPAIPQVRSYGVTAKIKKVGEKKSKVMGAEIGKGGDGEQQAKKQRGRKRKASFDADAEGEGEWGGEGDATKVVKERKKGGSLSVKDQEVVVKMEISEDDDAEDGKGVVDADGA